MRHEQDMQTRTGERPSSWYAAPETLLMLAVLQDALATFQQGLRSSVRRDVEALREVDQWFRSRDDDALYSFEHICDALGVSSAGVRSWLNAMREEAFRSGTLPGRRRISRERFYFSRAAVGPLDA